MSWILLIAMGLGAGAMTTWIGLGGGVVLTMALAVVIGPEAALTVAAPALFVGNAHRLALYWRFLHRKAFLWLGMSAAVGGLVGGLVATALPTSVLRFLLMSAPLWVLASRFRIPPRIRHAISIPFGFGSGALSATGGVGSALMGPGILSWGVSGSAFIATSSAVALAIHVGRITAYGVGGWMTADRLAMAAVLAVCIPVGNLLGRWARERTHEAVLDWGLRGALAGLAVLGIVNLGL